MDAIAIARRARVLMKENLVFAAIYNAIAVPFAIAGMVTPLIAALAMSGSSIMVTLNALRAGARKRCPAMNVLVYLVPMALGLGLIGLFAIPVGAAQRPIQRRRRRRAARAVG